MDQFMDPPEREEWEQEESFAPLPLTGACYGHAWSVLWSSFGVLFMVLLVQFFIELFGELIDGVADSSRGSPELVLPLRLFSLAYSLFVTGPLTFGSAYVCLKLVRGDTAQVGDLFEVFKNWMNAVLAVLLVGIVVLIGFVLLIIPGIYFGCKLAFVPYLIVDRKMGAMEAMSQSWEMTTGHAGQIFFIGLLAIPIALAGFICLLVGIIPAVMWIELAMSTMYYAVCAEQRAAMA